MGSKELKRSTLKAENIDADYILEFIKKLSTEIEIHNIVMIRNSKIVLEADWSPYSVNRPHVANSVTKTFIGIAIGMLFDKGMINLEDKLVSFFPEYKIDPKNERIHKVTIKHVLTMSVGFENPPAIDQERDWVSALLNTPLIFEPGTQFHYDSEVSFLLSAVFQKITGIKVSTYLREHLFKPLGIDEAYFLENKDDITIGGLGLFIPTIGLAKTGNMLISGGVFNGERIISEEWAEMTISKQINNSEVFPENKHESRQGYGFQCWMCTHNAVRMSGLWGQVCLMIPELDVVIAFNSRGTSSQPILDIFFDTAYKGIYNVNEVKSLPNQNKLSEYLKSLSIEPFKSESKHEMKEIINGSITNVSSNIYGLEKIKCSFDDDIFTLVIEKDGKEYFSKYGLGFFVEGDFNISKMYLPYYDSLSFGTPDNYIKPKAFGSYKWESESSLLLSTRYDNEATDYQIRLNFDYSYLKLEWMPMTIFTEFPNFTVHGKYREL